MTNNIYVTRTRVVFFAMRLLTLLQEMGTVPAMTTTPGPHRSVPDHLPTPMPSPRRQRATLRETEAVSSVEYSLTCDHPAVGAVRGMLGSRPVCSRLVLPAEPPGPKEHSVRDPG